MSRYADLDDHVDSDESVAILDNIGRRMLKRQVTRQEFADLSRVDYAD